MFKTLLEIKESQGAILAELKALHDLKHEERIDGLEKREQNFAGKMTVIGAAIGIFFTSVGGLLINHFYLHK